MIQNYNNDDFVGFSIQLYPTDEQKELLYKYFGVSRYVYNWALNKELEEYQKSNWFLREFELNKIFTKYKNDNIWLKEFDSTSLKIKLFDLVKAFKRFFDRQNNFSKFKSKKDCIQSMAVRSDTMSIYDDYVNIPCIGKIRCGNISNKNIIGFGWKRPGFENMFRKYYNPRLYLKSGIYRLSFTLKIDYVNNINYNSSINYPMKFIKSGSIIGIDLGFKKNNWIVDSNGVRVSIPDNSKEVKKINHLKKELSRKILHQKTNGEQYTETKNIMKIKKKIGKYNSRRHNKCKSKIYDYVNNHIIKNSPTAVVIEDLRTSHFIDDLYMTDIPKNNRSILINNIFGSYVYEFRRILSYMLPSHNIKLIVADNHYKSTQLCSNCGSEHKMITKRIYRCNNCGFVEDRDVNAACNLSLYPNRNNICVYY